MPKQIIIAEQHRIAAVFWEDQIQELVVATGSHQVGDIYLGVVENVLPGIDAAFVNIGDAERNGFIHVTDLGPLRLKRSAGAITELLTPQQKVLVQVMKEPTGNKGPRLTGNISLPGRYVVLMPFGRGVSLSRQIKNDQERNRLRALAVLIKPAGMGLIVRTEAEGRSEEAIIEDLDALQRQWEAIQQEVNSTRAPALLNRDDDFIQRVLRDMYSADVNRIVVDSSTAVKRVKQHLHSWSGGQNPEGVLIDHHRVGTGSPQDSRLSILEYFRVNAAIREALKPRVDLPSGGYIIIEPTEALTVIDVNSGSFTRSATARETVLWTNCEAATEIARQLRLRNIAGVIIVDFIDMDARRDQLQVLEHFNKALKTDKARPQIAQLSELGLVELTRKRQGQNIYELFGRGCPTCGGLGHLVHLPGESRNGEAIEPAATAVSLPNREVRWRNPSANPGAPVVRFSRDADSGSGSYRDSRSEDISFREEGATSGRDLNLPDLSERSSLPRVPRNDLPELDGDREEDPLDLLNHPSYQERGGPGANNRRRRRRREQESPSPRSIRLPSSPGVGSFRSSYEPEVEELPSVSREAPALEASISQPVVEEEVRRPKIERPKPSRVEVEPPERVVVEMTPLEQEVYAVMGIPPLAMANQSVKNPKSAIVSVVAPGTVTTELLSVRETPTVEENPGEVTQNELPLFGGNELPVADSGVAVDAIAPTPEAVETWPAETEVADIAPDVDSDENQDSTNTPVRRRRRRSSASS